MPTWLAFLLPCLTTGCFNLLWMQQALATGSISTEDRTGCKPCPAGASCDWLTGAVTLCLPGQHSPEGYDHCLPCSPGFVCADGYQRMVCCFLL
ncbi:signal peptide, CUB and EGF-like domain-containing protein 3 [Arapaima gigas]